MNQEKNFNDVHYAKITKVYDNSFFVKENGNHYYLYLDQEVYVGDEVYFETNYSHIENIDSFSMFLISNKTIYYADDVNNFTLIKSNDSTRNNLLRNLNKSESKYADYTLLFLFKSSDENNQYLSDSINKLGITHLFVISGMHIGIIYLITFYLFSSFIESKFTLQILASLISFYFLFITFFPISGIRAWIYRNIESTKKLTRENSLLLTAVFMIIINPFNVFSFSLILSFAITFLIIKIGKTNWTKKRKALSIPLFSFILALPIITIWDSSLNLFAPLLTIIISPLIFPLYLIILLFLPFAFLWKFLDPIFIVFDFIFLAFSFFYFPLLIPTFPLIIHFYLFIILLVFFHYFLKKNSDP